MEKLFPSLPVATLIRGLMLLIEGRKPLNLVTRKAKGSIYGRLLKYGKVAVAFQIDSNDEITVVVKEKDVIVVYE